MDGWMKRYFRRSLFDALSIFRFPPGGRKMRALVTDQSLWSQWRTPTPALYSSSNSHNRIHIPTRVKNLHFISKRSQELLGGISFILQFEHKSFISFSSLSQLFNLFYFNIFFVILLYSFCFVIPIQLSNWFARVEFVGDDGASKELIDCGMRPVLHIRATFLLQLTQIGFGEIMGALLPEQYLRNMFLLCFCYSFTHKQRA